MEHKTQITTLINKTKEIKDKMEIPTQTINPLASQIKDTLIIIYMASSNKQKMNPKL